MQNDDDDDAAAAAADNDNNNNNNGGVPRTFHRASASIRFISNVVRPFSSCIFSNTKSQCIVALSIVRVQAPCLFLLYSCPTKWMRSRRCLTGGGGGRGREAEWDQPQPPTRQATSQTVCEGGNCGLPKGPENFRLKLGTRTSLVASGQV